MVRGSAHAVIAEYRLKTVACAANEVRYGGSVPLIT